MSGIKVSATIIGQVGSAAPLPMIQPIADGVKNIVEYCETVRMHKQECIELKDLVVKYANTLKRATEGKSPDELDQHLADSLAELNDDLVRIRDTMQELSRKSFIQRMVYKGEYAELLSKHRKHLLDAIALFQTEQIIRSQIGVSVVTREVKRLEGSVYSIGPSQRLEGATFFLTQKPSLIL